jgi:pimeloyl-ACP methyl ester carboxylesterase
MTHMLAHRLAPLLPQVRAPAVVVRGEHDLIAPPRWAAEVAARLPRGRCVTIAGAAHAAHWSHPQAVAAVVDEVVDAAADAAVHDAVDGGTAHAAGGAPPPAADADAADPRPPLA